MAGRRMMRSGEHGTLREGLLSSGRGRGDLNQVKCAEEKRGGRMMADAAMGEFDECLTEIGLWDLGFYGYPFTWENKRVGGALIKERLDRFIANDPWRETMENCRVIHLEKERSDHRPLVCDTQGEADEEPK
ncbi:unnamed protein product [Linum trigynum]|uniref:Uncharacterized protein n=1 Tax=Linum trigynum TaxID=586398 RepID=A0AAV2E5Y1_9ROSI